MLVWLLSGTLLGGAVGALAAWLAAQAACARKVADHAPVAARADELARRVAELEPLRSEFASTAADLQTARANLAHAERAASDRAQLAGDLADARESIGHTEAQVAALREQLQLQRAEFDRAHAQSRESFAALANDALRKSNEQFFELAEGRFKLLAQQSDASLAQREGAITQLLQPVHQLLAQYRENLGQLEQARTAAYADLKQELGAVASAQRTLHEQTGQLAAALRRPSGGGRWGELTLRKLLEMAGLVRHCTFCEQQTVATENGDAKRPDCVVSLPDERKLVIDSKAAMQAYLDAHAASDERARASALQQHATNVRTHVRTLASKAYQDEFCGAADFVVLFVPGEAFLYAAADADPQLFEYALDRKVLIASPTSLLGMLRVIERTWRQRETEENALVVAGYASELCKRLGVLVDHVERVGDGLRAATGAYNAAVGSMNLRLEPHVRELERMSIAEAALVKSLLPLDVDLRVLSANAQALALPADAPVRG